MAETSLESRLITGAGKAIASDPLGLVATAQEAAGKRLTEGIEGIAASWAAKKAIVKARNDGYDKNWENTRAKMDENLGSLDADYWEKAGDHAEGLKVPYDACQAGKEGNRCRQREMMKLNQFITHTAEVKKTITAHKELEDKIAAGDLDKSAYQTNKSKAILGSLNGNQSTLGGVNDAEISKHDEEINELKEYLKSDVLEVGDASADDWLRTLNPAERREAVTKEIAGIQEKIEKLRKNDAQEYGWNISYIDDHTGEEVSERVTLKDLDGLINLKDNDITLNYMNTKKTIAESTNNYKEGVKGGKAFDENAAENNAEDTVDEDNIFSAMNDDLKYGKPLKERLKEHPVITNMTYSDLGIDVAADLDDDGIIDPEEWDAISSEGVDQIISALSDPTHPNFDYKTSKSIVVDDMVLNQKKESENDLYDGAGAGEYWNADNLEYPEGTPHNTLADKQKAIKEDLTTPQPGEDKQEFIERGGILGALANKGIKWNDETDTWTMPEYDEEGAYEKMKKDKVI